ncbi:MAG: hypothetical protein ONB12_04845, partial [candidate division KSB1 bacterium]|nr:hypothetical protein [candidate division KSB1 bacterium]
IAELAYQEHTGARGLTSVVDRVLLKFEKTLPDTDIDKLVVTREMVDHPQEELDKLLTQYYIKKFQKRFLIRNNIVITFTPEAIAELKRLASERESNLEAVATELLGDYEYGLKLLNCDEFVVDEEVVKNPKKRLEELIKSSYAKNR